MSEIENNNSSSDKTNLISFVIIIAVIGVLAVLAVYFFGSDKKKTDTTTATPATALCDGVDYKKANTNPIAKISTTKGCIITELLPSDAPKTVENFIGLADKGYYNNLTFHRVIDGFMIQTGDPKGDGTGGESFFGSKFNDELNPETTSYKAGYVKGTLAMANAGPNTNGSQFFITVADVNDSLQKNYSIFGKVVAGQDVADIISKVAVTNNAAGEKSKPVETINMVKVEIVK